MKNILVLDTGGTFSQEPTAKGLAPSNKDWLSLVPEIHELASITYRGLTRIDSTEMTTNERATLASIIHEEHQAYDGFVVVQGTDTMAESGAAISYMLPNNRKPIILTGSQIPIFEGTKTDAKRNIYHAVQAATSELGEVAVAFGDLLLRANRVQKIDEEKYKAFNTSRIPPLAEFSIDKKARLGSHATRRANTKPELHNAFDTQVAFYWQSSGTTTNHLEALVSHENVHGLVFAAFGAGNIQQKYHTSLVKAIQEHNKPVVVATQCPRGKAEFGLYDVSGGIVEAGAISARELTPQAATQKLMYALGRAQQEKVLPAQKQEYIKQIIQTDIAGDLQASTQVTTQAPSESALAQQRPYSYA